MPIWRKEPDEEPPITSVLILLDTLSRLNVATSPTAVLRAAWSAALEETRILLLDLVIAVDDAVIGGTV